MIDTVPAGRRFARFFKWLATQWQFKGIPWLLLLMFGVLTYLNLEGAFRHMHDWTMDSVNAAVKAAAAHGVYLRPARESDGWRNAITSELAPTMALLMVAQRQLQSRAVMGPAIVFICSCFVSLCAQLSTVGVVLPGAAKLLAALPMVALIVLAFFEISNMKYKREQAVAAERKAELARRQAELRAERDAEHRAELARQAAERQAELEAEQRRRDAEHRAELARQAAELEAERAARLAEIEQQHLTERARIEAAERQAERDERAALRAAEEKAAAEAKRQAERTLAQIGGASSADQGRRQRRPRAETQALVDAVLARLPAGTSRPRAVASTAAQLGVTEDYARQFIPADWAEIAASSANNTGVVRSEDRPDDRSPDDKGSAHGLRLVAAGRS